MRVTQIPRQAVQFGLWGARLPLTLADRVLIRGQEDTATWLPNLAFDKVEAGVKDIVGRATRDDTLVTAARLKRAEITRLERARAARVHATKVVDDAEAAAQSSTVSARLSTRRQTRGSVASTTRSGRPSSVPPRRPRRSDPPRGQRPPSGDTRSASMPPGLMCSVPVPKARPCGPRRARSEHVARRWSWTGPSRPRSHPGDRGDRLRRRRGTEDGRRRTRLPHDAAAVSRRLRRAHRRRQRPAAAGGLTAAWPSPVERPDSKCYPAGREGAQGDPPLRVEAVDRSSPPRPWLPDQIVLSAPAGDAVGAVAGQTVSPGQPAPRSAARGRRRLLHGDG